MTRNTNRSTPSQDYPQQARALRPFLINDAMQTVIASGAWSKIVRMDAASNVSQMYPYSEANLLTAAAASDGGDLVWVGPGNLYTDLTVPAGVGVVSMGNNTVLHGKVTLSDGSFLRGISVINSGAGGTVTAVLGPASGTAIINDTHAKAINSSGAAYGVQDGGGALWVWDSWTEGTATGGAGYGIFQSAGAIYITDDGKANGSTGKFSGEVQKYDYENEITLHDAAGAFTRVYPATQAGLIAALAAAASGDRVELPTDTIDLTTGISVPGGVALAGAGGYGSLNFASFAGTAIILGAYSSIQKLSIGYDGSGQTNAIGISASGDGWLVQLCSVYAHGASGNNYGIECAGATAPIKGFIEFSHFHGNGGANAHGIRVLSGGCVAASYSTGLGRNGSSTSYGLQNATGTSGNESWFEFCRFDGDTGAGARHGVNNSGYGVFYNNICNGTTYGFSNSGTARVCNNEWSSLNGSVTYLQGDRGAYSVEDYHANDIEAAALTRHLPLPAGDNSDDTKIAVVSGHNWVLGDPSANSPVVADYSEINVDNPPTKEQIDAAFSTPGVVGAGFLGIINDNGARINQYLVYSDGYSWNYMNWTKAIATIAAALAILAGDTFTDTNGTHLNAHTMDDGAGWTENSGSWTVSSNAAVQGSTTPSGLNYIATTDAGEADAKIRVRVKPSGASGAHAAGLILRFTDANNYWIVDFTTGASPLARISEVQGGVFANRASKTFTNRYQKYVDIEATCDGNAISATFDGGYGISYTSSFNNTATKHGVFEFRDSTPYQANTFEDFQVIGLPVFTWTRQGDVLTAGTGEGDNVLESSVIYEGNARILSGNVFKLWYTAGWGTWADIGIRYAESTTGLPGTWTKYGSNPLITHYARSSVFKDGGTYYMYASYEDTRLDLLTSTDGLAWTLDTSNVLPLGAGGAWDDQHIVNTFVWKEGASDWRLMYEGNSGGGFWHLGYATSSDGRTWTKSGSNPVISLDGGTGGPFVKKVGDYYYLFIHKAPHNGQVPTSLYRYRSTDLVTWTPYPMALELARIGADQGEDNYVGQLGDPFIVEANGTAYFFFSATSDGTQQSGNTHIEVATADPRAIYDW